MSWRYVLLGNPQSLEEIVEELKFQGAKKTDIVIEGHDASNIFRLFGGGSLGYYVVLYLSAKGTKMKLKEFPEDKFELGKVEAEKAALEESIGIARRLIASGFEVTINKSLVKDAEVALVKYEEVCRRYSQVRSSWF